MEKKLIECRTGCCLRRTLAAGRFSEDRCWGTMKMNDETVKGLLRKAGLKVTNQRMMVLDIIASHPAEHLTAEEIYDLAKVNSPEIGLATIYRTVQVLLDLHVIDKVTFDDGFTRYELNGEESASGHRHHHAICTGCGKVYSLESDLLDSLEEEVMEKLGFLVMNHEVKLYGLCSECRKNEEKKKEVMNREEREK